MPAKFKCDPLCLGALGRIAVQVDGVQGFGVLVQIILAQAGEFLGDLGPMLHVVDLKKRPFLTMLNIIAAYSVRTLVLETLF